MAVVWQRFLGWAFGVPVPVAATVGLAAAVWCVYLADRILDARKSPLPNTDRHRFAARHPRLLIVLALVSFVVGLGSVAFMPARFVWTGAGVAAAVGAYLAFVHAAVPRLVSRRGKEMAVGGVFAAGVAVPLLAEFASWNWVPAVVSFGLCCWWNCRLIDRWEERRPTGRTTGRLIGLTAAAVGVFSPLAVRVALLAAVGLLLLVDAAVPVLGVRLARVLIDVALLTPLPVWVFT